MVSEEIVKAEPALQQQDAPSVDETLTADNSDKVDLAIVFHLSTDIKPAEIKRYFVPLVTAIVEKAQIDSGNVRIALINYAKRARTKFNLAKYRTSAEVIKEIQSIDGGDRAKKSSGGSAFNEVRTDIFTSKGGDRPDAPNAVILITDDKNSDDQEQFVQEAEALKRAGVKIITVGMESANVDELRAVSSDPAVKNAIFAKTYVTAFSSDVVEQVRNTLAGLQERRAPPGRPEPEPERPTTGAPVSILDLRNEANADIVFAVHIDPSKRRPDFDILKSFIQSLIAGADVDNGRVRFGFVNGDKPPIFYLNRYTTNEEINRALAPISKNNFRLSRFDLTGTLRRIRTEVFQSQAGDRENVANAVILITDTNSGQDYSKINEEKTRLAQQGIQVYTLGVGLSDKGELETIASSDRNVFSFSDYNELQRFGSALRNEIRALNTRRPPPDVGEFSDNHILC
ncbi:unnamed protein product [Candidula unifasciata]|uniref:VWFA domain-containing protein n=1 Tax=Candidula unifasciata TaxID=100452 RepID=A0A8S4A4N0_9EUPU|nr:unnamed protein product [Candidula unifasciata]